MFNQTISMRSFVGGAETARWNPRRKQFGRGGYDSLSRFSALRFFGVAVAAVVLLSPLPARAQYYWQSLSSTADWSNAANWSGGLPTSSGTAYITNGGTANVTQTGEVCNNLVLGGTGGGAVQMSGGSLSASYVYAGSGGAGAFGQSGGTNSIGVSLYLGYNSADSGSYSLSGTGQLSAREQYVGYSGTGSFTQSGGSNNLNDTIYLGYNAGSSGSYTFSAGQVSASLCVGYSGTGSFTQSGGSNTANYEGPITNFCLGYNAGSSGTYNLSGGRLTSLAPEYVGYSGQGSFTLSSGTNSVNGEIVLGCNPGSSGSYTLSGNGQLLAPPNQYVGYSGAGVFTQSGGTSATSAGLYLGYNAGSSGTYILNGNSQLSVIDEWVGYSSAASALFQQSAGSNATAFLGIGGGGRYTLSGGTLDITGNGGIYNQGVLDFGNSQATLAVGSSCIVDLSQANLTNVGAMNVSVAASSLLIVPAGFNPYTAFGSFSCSSSSIVHTVGTTLVVPAGKNLYGQQASINDPVNCQGSLVAVISPSAFVPSGTISLNNGLALSGSGVVNLGAGNLTVNDAASGISGSGALSVQYQYVGQGGTGTFAQSGGTNTVNVSLYLGVNAGDVGAYNLSAGQLKCWPTGAGLSASEYVGYAGAGTLNQSGGANYLEGSYYGGLYLGDQPGSSGTYILGKGALLESEFTQLIESIGVSGSGTFVQSGGTNAVDGGDGLYFSSNLNIGAASGGVGNYQLINGQVSTSYENVGAGGTGTFTQSGGTNAVETGFSYFAQGMLTIGSAAGAIGTYNLSAGSLSAVSEYLGYAGAGTFNQSGGANTTNSLTLAYTSGANATYNFTGGTLAVSSLGEGSGNRCLQFRRRNAPGRRGILHDVAHDAHRQRRQRECQYRWLRGYACRPIVRPRGTEQTRQQRLDSSGRQ